MSSSRTVIVYRDTLLPVSETFIRCQGDSLRRFQPIYVGLRRTPSLPLPESRVRLLCRDGIVGKVQRARFTFLGPTRNQQKALSKEGPLLFHAHFGPDGSDVLTLAHALKIPLVVSLHGYDVNSRGDGLPARYLRRRGPLQKSAARFICISEFIRKQAIAQGFPAEKTVVHYTGIDTDFFRPNPATPRLPVVLFVGRLSLAKGCDCLLAAMAFVQKAMPDAKLVVIGDGPQRTELEQQAAALLLNCDFLGLQPPEVVRDWMNRAMVFSSPSCVTAVDQEGFGMTFAEAQAMGLPVVSTFVGGIPEAVADEQTGFLVPERSPEALAAKLLTLLQNRELWSNFSEAGRIRVGKLFDIQRQAVHLESIYESVLTEWESQMASETALERQQTSDDNLIEA